MIEGSLIMAMCLFAFSMSISPGPVNLLVLSSGVNHGVRQTMPFVLGAVIGFTLLLIVVGFGLANILFEHYWLSAVLCLAGNSFIAYIGCSLWRASTKIAYVESSLPGFWQGSLLQWLNPKAWAACLAGVSGFNLIHAKQQLLLFVGLYFFICLVSMSSWAVAGEKIRLCLTVNKRLRLFNRFMAVSLIAIALYLTWSFFLAANG